MTAGDTPLKRVRQSRTGSSGRTKELISVSPVRQSTAQSSANSLLLLATPTISQSIATAFQLIFSVDAAGEGRNSVKSGFAGEDDPALSAAKQTKPCCWSRLMV